MTWTLAVDAVVPGCARIARVASDRPFDGSIRPASHRFADVPVRSASHRFAQGLVRPASRPGACVPVLSSRFRPASHRRVSGAEPLIPQASAPWAVTSRRAGGRPWPARPPCLPWAARPPHPPRPRQPASARRRDVPDVRGGVVTLADWSFDPGRDDV
jgi:hypothetical protein